MASRERGVVGSGWRRDALERNLADIVLLESPTTSGAVVTAFAAALLSAEYLPAVHHTIAVLELIAWLVALAAGCVAYVYVLRAVAHVLRHEPFGAVHTGRLAAKLYGGYGSAAVLATATQTLVHRLIDPGGATRDHFVTAVARATVFVIVGPIVNALLALRRLVREKDATLRERLDDLDRARAMLARADELVRREAAEVLHGRVQSRLLAAQVQIERVVAASPPEQAGELAEVLTTLDDLRVNDVRATSHRLHPPAIRVGLMAAIRSLVASFEGSFAVEVDLRVSHGVLELDDPMSGALDEDARLVVYRALEEALTNAYRHGGATRVDVELALVADRRLQLRVVDDGRGFDSDGFTMGLGIASVAARVEGRGGIWWIAPRDPRGTVFTAVLPVAVRGIANAAAAGAAQSPTVTLPSR